MNSKPEECLVKTAHNAMDIKTALSWSHMKVCPLPQLKNCKMVHKRHHDHSQVKAVYNRTELGISTHITSRDSYCTRRDRILVSRKHNKLGKAALRDRHNRAIHEEVGSNVNALLQTIGSVVACLWQPVAQKYLKVDCGWTLRASTQNTFWRVRLKDSQEEELTSVADFNTLMLLNVYITHECLPALRA